MKEFVKVQDITKTYKMGEVEIHAVDHISFSIEQGELVVIVGPSGAGKTTVLNILGGMDTATSGKLYVDGKDITAYNSKQLTGYRRDDIGFVFQFYNLVPNLTALENVELRCRSVRIRWMHRQFWRKLVWGNGRIIFRHSFPAVSSSEFQSREH